MNQLKWGLIGFGLFGFSLGAFADSFDRCQSSEPVLEFRVDDFQAVGSDETEDFVLKSGTLVNYAGEPHLSSLQYKISLVFFSQIQTWAIRLVFLNQNPEADLGLPYTLHRVEVSLDDQNLERDWTYGCQQPGLSVFYGSEVEDALLIPVSDPSLQVEKLELRLYGNAG